MLCALFTALIAVSAFLKIPIPLMDYFTLQFLFVLLAGMLLGPVLGALSVGVYVAIGLVGFPIFAAGGGIQYVFRPSFGYLLGFIAAAGAVGLLCQRIKKQGFWQYLFIALLGMVITYAIGFTYKYMILNFYLDQATSVGAVVLASLSLDIPGDIVLCIASALLVKRLRRAARLEVVQ